MEQREEAMAQRFCSLIVLGPSAPRAFKVHLSRNAILILVVAFMMSFLAVVLLGYSFPHVDEMNRAKLKAENYALKLEAQDAAKGLKNLDTKVVELETASKRIEDLMAAQ
jgi:hypothetical protein